MLNDGMRDFAGSHHRALDTYDVETAEKLNSTDSEERPRLTDRASK